ncbi:hypothetical protein DPMN_189567 [Dreissena polymorpha]|uniref:Ig-like domain-containing protein n=1 Tax=Dreissena polymorpha TaxID=45954 RepID=A0A9D4IAY3_DREPO|nr:hypothetical protein DPMN_189567 [Dreissena polymorpha]
MHNTTTLVLQLLFQVTVCNVLLTTKVNRTVSSIECSSRFNIQFLFKKESSNNERLIAECDHSLPGCYLVDGLGKEYAVSWTKNGGEIIIKDNENARGRYTCCETSDNRTCSSTEIGPSKRETTTLTTERNVVYIHNHYYGETNSPGSGGNTSHVIVSFTIIVVLLLGLVILILLLQAKGRITCPMCFTFCRRKCAGWAKKS